ncbi:hypothetical protein NC651_027614 [Populus alba x Populus x berolinensis]|nr:hypothetical protein NC651_027614 [Populus alba x Populus x berolinensis]
MALLRLPSENDDNSSKKGPQCRKIQHDALKDLQGTRTSQKQRKQAGVRSQRHGPIKIIIAVFDSRIDLEKYLGYWTVNHRANHYSLMILFCFSQNKKILKINLVECRPVSTEFKRVNITELLKT